MPQILCPNRITLSLANIWALYFGIIYIPLNTHWPGWSLWLWLSFRKSFNPLLWAIGSSWKEHMPFFVVLPQFLGAIGPILPPLVPKSQFFLWKWLTHLTQIVSPESSWENDHYRVHFLEVKIFENDPSVFGITSVNFGIQRVYILNIEYCRVLNSRLGYFFKNLLSPKRWLDKH